MRQLALFASEIPGFGIFEMPMPGRGVGRVVAHGWVGVDQFGDSIRLARSRGESVASIAKRFNVTPQRIYQVLK